jgi:chromosome segregation ATPase
VRKAKSDLKEKEQELAKMKEGREQLVKTIEEMQEIIRKHDSDSTNTSKSISAMQAVSQASMDRLGRLETELAAKVDELMFQKRALDSAWAEIAELKRAAADARADRDDTRRVKEEREQRVAETEAQLRDLEQREAVLRATNKQLQDSVQRQAQEAAAREDRLREEIADARKRWQDAVSTRESLAAEVGQATGPLLRQISSLQESIKAKTEAWQGVESALLEKALRAESSAESAVYRARLLEERSAGMTKQIEELTSRLHEKESALQALEVAAERWARSERDAADRIQELETRLAAESTQRLNAQSAMRELESRLKSETREVKDTLEATNKQAQMRAAMLNTEIEYLRGQLQGLKANDAAAGTALKSEKASNESLSSGNASRSGLEKGYLPSTFTFDRIRVAYEVLYLICAPYFQTETYRMPVPIGCPSKCK